MLSMFCGMALSATFTTPRIRGKRCLLIWKLHKRLLFACSGKGFANRRVRLLGPLKLMQTLSVLRRPTPAIFGYDLDLLVEDLAGKRSIAIRRQKGDNPAASPSQTSASISRRKCGSGKRLAPSEFDATNLSENSSELFNGNLCLPQNALQSLWRKGVMRRHSDP